MRNLHSLALVIAAILPGVAAAGSGQTRNPGTLGEVLFAFDSSSLAGDAEQKLDAAATFAQIHPDSRIVLDAHCDPIGTSPYNVGLAIRRAQAVATRLVAMGVPKEQIVFAIYGKDGERRARHAEDRRVTVWSTHDSLAMVIDRTLAARGTAVTWEQPLSTAQIEALPEPVASR